jgi:hypothetical protein
MLTDIAYFADGEYGTRRSHRPSNELYKSRCIRHSNFATTALIPRSEIGSFPPCTVG